MVVSIPTAFLAVALFLPQVPPPAVVESSSGLKVVELRAGTGARLSVGDMVVLDYTARQPDGTVVDRRSADEPARMFVGPSNPKFWEEVLPRLRVGGRYSIGVPPASLWPESLWPAGVPRDAAIAYEVHVQEAIPRPKLVKPDAESSHEDDAGFTYEIVAVGEGAPPRPEDWFEVHYTIWDHTGELAENTRYAGAPARMRVDTVQSPFLRVAPLRMKPGARWRCAMKAEYAYGRPHPTMANDALTYWDITMVRVTPALPMPMFRRPTADELTTTASGLQYQVVEEGKGEAPSADGKVRVHFVAWLEDGTVVDSSYAFGRPTEMTVARAIPGVAEALRLMRTGAVHCVVLPAALAYGQEGVKGLVPAGSRLIYRIDLVEVMP